MLTGSTPGFILSRRHWSVLLCITKGHSRTCTISYNQRAFLYPHYFPQPKGILVSTVLYNPRVFLYLYYFVQPRGILVSTVLFSRREFLYVYYFVQPKVILVSTLFRTAKGNSCISTISYNPRAFLYLYYFVQPKGILECLPILTTKCFHIFVLMFLLSDNTLSST
jgi:hypothetical protein